MVPVGTAQVGCALALAVGAAGAPGTASMVNEPLILLQVVSLVSLTVMV